VQSTVAIYFEKTNIKRHFVNHCGPWLWTYGDVCNLSWM